MGLSLLSAVQASGGRHADLTQIVRAVGLPIAHGVETIAHASWVETAKIAGWPEWALS